MPASATDPRQSMLPTQKPKKVWQAGAAPAPAPAAEDWEEELDRELRFFTEGLDEHEKRLDHETEVANHAAMLQVDIPNKVPDFAADDLAYLPNTRKNFEKIRTNLKSSEDELRQKKAPLVKFINDNRLLDAPFDIDDDSIKQCITKLSGDQVKTSSFIDKAIEYRRKRFYFDVFTVLKTYAEELQPLYEKCKSIGGDFSKKNKNYPNYEKCVKEYFKIQTFFNQVDTEIKKPLDPKIKYDSFLRLLRKSDLDTLEYDFKLQLASIDNVDDDVSGAGSAPAAANTLPGNQDSGQPPQAAAGPASQPLPDAADPATQPPQPAAPQPPQPAAPQPTQPVAPDTTAAAPAQNLDVRGMIALFFDDDSKFQRKDISYDFYIFGILECAYAMYFASDPENFYAQPINFGEMIVDEVNSVKERYDQSATLVTKASAFKECEAYKVFFENQQKIIDTFNEYVHAGITNFIRTRDESVNLHVDDATRFLNLKLMFHQIFGQILEYADNVGQQDLSQSFYGAFFPHKPGQVCPLLSYVLNLQSLFLEAYTKYRKGSKFDLDNQQLTRVNITERAGTVSASYVDLQAVYDDFDAVESVARDLYTWLYKPKIVSALNGYDPFSAFRESADVLLDCSYFFGEIRRSDGSVRGVLEKIEAHFRERVLKYVEQTRKEFSEKNENQKKLKNILDGLNKKSTEKDPDMIRVITLLINQTKIIQEKINVIGEANLTYSNMLLVRSTVQMFYTEVFFNDGLNQEEKYKNLLSIFQNTYNSNFFILFQSVFKLYGFFDVQLDTDVNEAIYLFEAFIKKFVTALEDARKNPELILKKDRDLIDQALDILFTYKTQVYDKMIDSKGQSTPFFQVFLKVCVFCKQSGERFMSELDHILRDFSDAKLIDAWFDPKQTEFTRVSDRTSDDSKIEFLLQKNVLPIVTSQATSLLKDLSGTDLETPGPVKIFGVDISVKNASFQAMNDAFIPLGDEITHVQDFVVLCMVFLGHFERYQLGKLDLDCKLISDAELESIYNTLYATCKNMASKFVELVNSIQNPGLSDEDENDRYRANCYLLYQAYTQKMGVIFGVIDIIIGVFSSDISLSSGSTQKYYQVFTSSEVVPSQSKIFNLFEPCKTNFDLASFDSCYQLTLEGPAFFNQVQKFAGQIIENIGNCELTKKTFDQQKETLVEQLQFYKSYSPDFDKERFVLQIQEELLAETQASLQALNQEYRGRTGDILAVLGRYNADLGSQEFGVVLRALHCDLHDNMFPGSSYKIEISYAGLPERLFSKSGNSLDTYLPLQDAVIDQETLQSIAQGFIDNIIVYNEANTEAIDRKLCGEILATALDIRRKINFAYVFKGVKDVLYCFKFFDNLKLNTKISGQVKIIFMICHVLLQSWQTEPESTLEKFLKEDDWFLFLVQSFKNSDLGSFFLDASNPNQLQTSFVESLQFFQRNEKENKTKTLVRKNSDDTEIILPYKLDDKFSQNSNALFQNLRSALKVSADPSNVWRQLANTATLCDTDLRSELYNDFFDDAYVDVENRIAVAIYLLGAFKDLNAARQAELDSKQKEIDGLALQLKAAQKNMDSLYSEFVELTVRSSTAVPPASTADSSGGSRPPPSTSFSSRSATVKKDIMIAALQKTLAETREYGLRMRAAAQANFRTAQKVREFFGPGYEFGEPVARIEDKLPGV